MKLFLGIPIDQILEAEKNVCSEIVPLTLHHAMNCHGLITYRTCLRNAVRDAVAQMARVTHISCITEPLLKETLSSDKFTETDRGDTIIEHPNLTRSKQLVFMAFAF
ncbi:hypothetical protein RCL1_004046 [Eukaryota sp. TZLM3-RCL]